MEAQVTQRSMLSATKHGQRIGWVCLVFLVGLCSSVGQGANTATATKTKNPGGTYSTTSSGYFPISTAQTVKWTANYYGSGTEGDGFYLHQSGQPMNAEILSENLSSGLNTSTYYLTPGNYEISINYWGMGPGNYSIEYNLTASIAASPPSYSFGNVLEGGSSTKTFTISSTGDLDVTISNIVSSDPAHFVVQNAPTGQKVPPDKTFEVKFLAGSISGNTPVSHNATITVSGTSTSGSVTPFTVTVSGTTTPNKPQIEVSVSSLAFGDVVAGTSSTKQFSIKNKGPAPLTFSMACDNSLYSVSPSSGTVPGGSPSNPQSKTMTVTFAPPAGTSAGLKTGTLTITHDDPTQGSRLVTLSATVIPNEPRIAVSPTSLNFGSVVAGTSDTRQFSITNTGPAVLSFSISCDSSMYSVSPASGTVPGGSVSNPQSKTITVTFAPPAQTPAGSQVGQLTVTHNDPTKGAQFVTLTGGVVLPTRILSVSPSSLDFKKVGIYYNFTQEITVKNTGNSLLTVTGIASSKPEFTVTPTAFSLAANGGTQKIEVTFSPTLVGSASGTLTFTSDATNTPAPTVSLAGEGIVPPPADVYLVLDGSGSMIEKAGSTLTKMDRLHSAAKLFIDLARTGQGDKLGLVRFDHPTVDHLVPLDVITATGKAQMKNKVDQIQPSGWTSIGNGIKQAFDVLIDPTKSTAQHKVVLLLSDGMENRPLFLDSANGIPVYNMPTQPDIEVYTVGLGLPENMNADLLSWLALERAQTAKGHFNTTNEEWIKLHKFFINILSDTFLTQYTVYDPVYQLGPGQNVLIPVNIVDSDKGVTFTAYWMDRRSQLRVELITPSGGMITPENASLFGMEYVMGDLYAFYRVSFLPPNKPLGLEKTGVWTQVITALQVPQGKETVSVSVIAPSDLSFEPTIGKGIYATGESILLSAKLLERGRPVADADVVVTVTAPTAGLGNVLSEYKVFDMNFPAVAALNPDSVSTPKLEKVKIMQEQWNMPLIAYEDRVVELFDDGLHGDGSAHDGVWANTYDRTNLEGVYAFTFQASAVSRLGEFTTREKTVSTTVEIKAIDVQKTTIEVERFIPRGMPAMVGYQVAIVPRDSLGNYVGPGRARSITIEAQGMDFVGEVTDNNAGEYSRVVYLPTKLNPDDIDVTLTILGTKIHFNLGEAVRAGGKPVSIRVPGEDS